MITVNCFYFLTIGTVVFYDEVQNEYIKDCDKSNNTVFQNFAKLFVDHKNNFTKLCPEFCVPLYIEPITDTINHDVPNCNHYADYYCMYQPKSLKIVTSLAPQSIKPCVVKSPKLKNFPSKYTSLVF